MKIYYQFNCLLIIEILTTINHRNKIFYFPFLLWFFFFGCCCCRFFVVVFVCVCFFVCFFVLFCFVELIFHIYTYRKNTNTVMAEGPLHHGQAILNFNWEYCIVTNVHLGVGGRGRGLSFNKLSEM